MPPIDSTDNFASDLSRSEPRVRGEGRHVTERPCDCLRFPFRDLLNEGTSRHACEPRYRRLLPSAAFDAIHNWQRVRHRPSERLEGHLPRGGYASPRPSVSRSGRHRAVRIAHATTRRAHTVARKALRSAMSTSVRKMPFIAGFRMPMSSVIKSASGLTKAIE